MSETREQAAQRMREHRAALTPSQRQVVRDRENAARRRRYAQDAEYRAVRKVRAQVRRDGYTEEQRQAAVICAAEWKKQHPERAREQQRRASAAYSERRAA